MLSATKAALLVDDVVVMTVDSEDSVEIVSALAAELRSKALFLGADLVTR